jgi:hypothetical protein
MEEIVEPFFEAENRTMCPSTGGRHSWVWDSNNQDYYCDECGVSESRQEDYY